MPLTAAVIELARQYGRYGYRRIRPEYRHHVWSWGFVMEPTHDGRVLKILMLIVDHGQAYLALPLARQILSNDVIDVLTEAIVEHAVPSYLRSAGLHFNQSPAIAGFPSKDGHCSSRGLVAAINPFRSRSWMHSECVHEHIGATLLHYFNRMIP